MAIASMVVFLGTPDSKMTVSETREIDTTALANVEVTLKYY